MAFLPCGVNCSLHSYVLTQTHQPTLCKTKIKQLSVCVPDFAISNNFKGTYKVRTKLENLKLTPFKF
jgi:hypothetical protein